MSGDGDPGVHGRDYRHPPPRAFEFLAERGVQLVRLPFRWERLQPELFEPLDADELDLLLESIRAADDAGLSVIPTPMNYGARWHEDPDWEAGRRHPIGTDEVPSTAFADLWRRLAHELADEPAVVAYGLMNEPADVPGHAPTWEQITQEAVDAIRGTGSQRTIAVPGYRFSGVRWFPEAHPDGPWIIDPADDVRYEAHQYFDAQGDGYYAGYDDELERAEAEDQSDTASEAGDDGPPP